MEIKNKNKLIDKVDKNRRKKTPADNKALVPGGRTGT